MFWQRFKRPGIPDYLARHYWWAYLAPPMVWFFDHQPIINLILFGQYKRLMHQTLARFHAAAPGERVLQITNVYGELTPTVVDALGGGDFHLLDVAEVQLKATRRKLDKSPSSRNAPVFMARMNAESLAYAEDSFDTVIIFFLLHELPVAARRRVLAEALRVLRPGGRLLTTDYGALTRSHFLHRVAPLRGIIGRAEPFLPAFWKEDLPALIEEAAASAEKAIASDGMETIFGGFYRVAEFRLGERRKSETRDNGEVLDSAAVVEPA